MDRLWSPWRYRYVAEGVASEKCIFCEKAASKDDDANLIVFRGIHCYVVLNLYPYTNGHLMVVPYAHVDSLAAAPAEAAQEMMTLARTAESALRRTYNPGGINLGMNLGECAGAGVAGHIHMHVLPRWYGDSNFMSVVGETRVLVEELAVTRARLHEAFRQLSA